jgi:hypothetical protein
VRGTDGLLDAVSLRGVNDSNEGVPISPSSMLAATHSPRGAISRATPSPSSPTGDAR